MRSLSLGFASIVIGVSVLLSGCAGSSSITTQAGGLPDSKVTGVWHADSTRVEDHIDLGLNVTAGVVSGVAALTRDSHVFVGDVTGTNSADGLHFNVDFHASLTWQVVMTFPSDTTAIATVVENGTTSFTINFQIVGSNNPPDIHGAFSGSWNSATTGGEGPMTMNVVQDLNKVTGTFNLTGAKTVSGTFRGVFIGSNFTAVMSYTNDNQTVVTWTAQLAGANLSGGYQAMIGTQVTDAGGFNVTKQ